jgi:c-di-GMP-binding flagellar brake protein YcgR
MDSRITIGDKIDLEKIETRLSVDPDKRPPVYVSQVLDDSDNGEILAAMPFQEGKVVPLSVGQKFHATFYSQSGLLRCEVEVTGRYKKVQRREFFRLACNLPIEYRIVSDVEMKLIEEGTSYDEESMKPEWKKGVILDLSGGGIRFVSSYREEKDSFLQVRFEMPVEDEDEIFCLYATLLRCEQNRNNTTLYDQRVMFWRLDYTLREKVIRSIFEIQRKNRSKATGND